MSENSQGSNNHAEDMANTSQLSGDTITVQGATFTQEEIDQANKAQPNVILDKVGEINTEVDRDSNRVNERANEASDSTDTNTGGIISGAAKGANQS